MLPRFHGKALEPRDRLVDGGVIALNTRLFPVQRDLHPSEIGADAVLIGEALMKAPDKKARLAELRGLA